MKEPLATDAVPVSKPYFGFEAALSHLKNGCSVAREAWRDKGISVHLQVPDEHSKMTEPYLYMEKCIDGKLKRFPLDLSCESILAEDWEVVK